MNMAAVLSALDAGDNAAAEAALRPLLAATPDDGQLLRQLAEIQYRRNAFGDCEATLARLMAMTAVTPAELRQLAKVKTLTGKSGEAQGLLRDAMRQAPNDIDAMVAYADSFAATPARAAAALEALLPQVAGRLDRTSHLLKHITLHRARANRIAAGAHPDAATSWHDLCLWPDPRGLARLHEALLAEIGAGANARAGAYMDLAWVALAHQKWDLAERALARVRGAVRDPIADCAAFGPAFHAALEQQGDGESLRGFAPVHHVCRLDPQSPATLFLASDYVYFKRFTLKYVKALEDAGVPADVQVHLLDGDAAQWAAAAADLAFLRTVRVGLSAEASGAGADGILKARVYYHAMRFVRLYQEVKRTGRPTWLLDADVNFVRDPAPVFATFRNFDVAVRANPAWLEPNWKIAAACVGIAPTALGLEYARRVAAYVAYWKARDRWAWGVDQTALYSCFARMCECGRQPATWFLGRDVLCGPGDGGGVFQLPSGILKYAPREASVPEAGSL